MIEIPNGDLSVVFRINPYEASSIEGVSIYPRDIIIYGMRVNMPFENIPNSFRYYGPSDLPSRINRTPLANSPYPDNYCVYIVTPVIFGNHYGGVWSDLSTHLLQYIVIPDDWEDTYVQGSFVPDID